MYVESSLEFWLICFASAALLKIEIIMLCFFLLFQRLKAQSLSQLVCRSVVNAKMWSFNNVNILTLGILK